MSYSLFKMLQTSYPSEVLLSALEIKIAVITYYSSSSAWGSSHSLGAIFLNVSFL